MDPYLILNAGEADSDEILREKYLSMVRKFPPERHPEDFKKIQEAYVKVKTVENRIHNLFFPDDFDSKMSYFDYKGDEECQNKSISRLTKTEILKLIRE